MSMMKATFIVHWPGQDTPACEDHADKLRALAVAMGFSVSATRCETDDECKNCQNEEVKKLNKMMDE